MVKPNRFVYDSPEEYTIIRTPLDSIIMPKHAQGMHDQKTHGRRGAAAGGSADVEEFEHNVMRTFTSGQDDVIYQNLRDEQRQYIENLSKEQLQAVATYQSMDYEDINAGLRGQKPLSPENQKVVSELDGVIANAELPINTTVYRGIVDENGAFSNLQVGDTLTDAGYLSTSPNPAVAEAFANGTLYEGNPIVLEIDVPSGHPALASDVASAFLANDIEEAQSMRLDENEMLAEVGGFVRLNEITLPRGLPLEVTGISEKENAKYIKVRIKS